MSVLNIVELICVGVVAIFALITGASVSDRDIASTCFAIGGGTLVFVIAVLLRYFGFI